MKTVIDKTLRDVQRVNSFARLFLISEHYLVHRWTIERLIEVCCQTVGDIASVQDSSLRGFTQAVMTVSQCVRQGAQHHSIVAIKRLNSTNGSRLIVFESNPLVVLNYSSNGKNSFE